MQNTINQISIACIIASSMMLGACGTETDVFDLNEGHIDETSAPLRMKCAADDGLNTFSLNPCDPTNDMVDNIIFTLAGGVNCLDNCFTDLADMTDDCRGRGLSGQRLTYCLEMASSAYESCARSCQVDYPAP